MYLKANYRVLSRLNVFADMQLRKVEYRYFGLMDNAGQKYQNQSYLFFNPKLGLSYDAGKHLNVYGSVAVANKEPSGDDLSKNLPLQRPKDERLTDLELGARYNLERFFVGVGFYNMQYKNQLVLNGQIDNVGNPKHVNVANSYRRGAEVEVSAGINKYLTLGGNITLSTNKILNFTEYIDDDHINNYKNTDISFSPNLVSSVMAVVKPVKHLEVTLTNKYVGKQFLDNTSNNKRSMAAYNVVDLRLNYSIKTKIIPEISFMFSLNNVFAAEYVTNGYTYSYYDGNDLVTQNLLSPAALRNFMGGLSLKF
ncbi:MAG: TonB-dependent receptor [Bacteroidia bacterium]|nr:TonB-dependent receptor [Bacteroidia bacterium]